MVYDKSVKLDKGQADQPAQLAGATIQPHRVGITVITNSQPSTDEMNRLLVNA